MSEYDQERKFDKGKLKYDLVPWDALDEVVRVLQHGAIKYGPESWKKVYPKRRYKNALLRHVSDYIGKQEQDDQDSGIHHLAHAICNCLFLIHSDQKEKIYIAGPMSGYEEHNKDSFLKAERLLIKKGYEVISPRLISEEVREKVESPGFEDYMRRDLEQLIKCDIIYLLEGWGKSKGAWLEYQVAKGLGMSIMFEGDEVVQ